MFQALANDMWNFGCSAGGPNCIILDDTNSVDFDFGGPAILVDAGDRELLVAGQKSGDLWALNPDTGALVWNQRVGEGTALGGNHWGITTNSERAFMTINDPGGMNGNSRPGLYSYFLGTGEPSWFYEVTPDCEGRSDRLRRCEDLPRPPPSLPPLSLPSQLPPPPSPSPPSPLSSPSCSLSLLLSLAVSPRTS